MKDWILALSSVSPLTTTLAGGHVQIDTKKRQEPNERALEADPAAISDVYYFAQGGRQGWMSSGGEPTKAVDTFSLAGGKKGGAQDKDVKENL